MDFFKECSKRGIVFHTPKGVLDLYSIWTLKKADIAKALRSLQEEISKSEVNDELSFLDEANFKISTNDEIKFAVLKEVYLTKKAEEEAAVEKASSREHNEKIYALIEKKKQEKLEDLSEEELLKLLK